MGYRIGIDIGSTTVKVVILGPGPDNPILFKHYERHFSQVRTKTAEVLRQAREIVGDSPVQTSISGSAGMGVAKAADLPFVQEVFATSETVKHWFPGTDAVVELGGEDAKIIFITGGLEERMNGTCAGGTGAFIDQMATLLAVTPQGLDELSLKYKKMYPIASRCGVFAKSDIQPLLNQGANKSDIAMSIFQAVVNQTITGLAQGRRIEGKVAFLGGPLHFFKGLQQRFQQTLGLDDDHALFPELGLFSVAMGAAVCSENTGKPMEFQALLEKIENSAGEVSGKFLPPLFASEEEYAAFQQRHAQASVPKQSIQDYIGGAYLGIDCGSTTTKLVLIGEDGQILFEYYSSNQGNPVDIVREQLLKIRTLCERDRETAPPIEIKACVTTGYGEDLMRAAFNADMGIVETMAHYRAARFFNPKVDFILDIGGQDIKCFKVRNNSIDSIMLNEACSSGCGSFIETFARSMGYTAENFAKVGLFAKRPSDLGSRCTVFMNSSVKQAQKDGAGVDDISAGLSISVVKNAIYKVIRAHSASELGENIVVQGGTFYNDAVLRSFEQELGRDVVRPAIAGLMGAYGAALYGRDMNRECSSLLSIEELETFSHQAKPSVCGLCANHCNLTVNFFSDGSRFISGNRCERPLGRGRQQKLPNLYEFKLERIKKLAEKQNSNTPMGKIGIPLGLNMYENLPFWHAFLSELGFEVVTSAISSLELYSKGRTSIPSDTACYPAKLMHGHIMDLLEKGIETIFYPCMSYNFDEGKGDNHYNCPVVAYYPELLHANMTELKNIRFLFPYVGIHRKKDFEKKICKYLQEQFPKARFRMPVIQKASDAAYAAYTAWGKEIRQEGEKAIALCREKGTKMIVLSGRPYHVDPEINHGIDKLIAQLGLAVLSEDSVAHLIAPQRVDVLNQWTYHTRLYNAAAFVAGQPDMELVQLVSFGCGIDAITTDEVMAILEEQGRLYTQLKIDEINNLGAVRIRIRSLLGAAEERSIQAKNQFQKVQRIQAPRALKEEVPCRT